MPQTVEDLFAQFQIVDGGERLGRYITHFRKQFMESETIRIGGGRTIEKWHARRDAVPLLTAKIADVSMRLQAEDYLTMPELSHNIIPVQLPPAARKTYDALADDLVAKTDGGATLTAVTAAAAVMKLRQITNGWAYDADGESTLVHEAKLDALADLVEEQSGSPIIVAVAFLHEVAAIRTALKSVLPEGTSTCPTWAAACRATRPTSSSKRLERGRVPGADRAPDQRGARLEPAGWRARAGLVRPDVELRGARPVQRPGVPPGSKQACGDTLPDGERHGRRGHRQGAGLEVQRASLHPQLTQEGLTCP